MKSQITVSRLSAEPNGYRMDVVGRFGGGYTRHVTASASDMAAILRREIGKYIASNPDGGDFVASPEVIAALEAGPLTGRRISYYASAEAWNAIQAKREATGDSQSGAINALVLRNEPP